MGIEPNDYLHVNLQTHIDYLPIHSNPYLMRTLSFCLPRLIKLFPVVI